MNTNVNYSSQIVLRGRLQIRKKDGVLAAKRPVLPGIVTGK
jgi:hypothetical protein